ncbi:hypothetical protein EVAR_57229_1 [Eumeta japonica]|uniref:Uncharacterized protein n=1 Tax=Eumeta variegata TaxID=151549 RepID=A0A4C1YGI8_EUMVA|nr:hypothetical protein EVAR_57229_1 [Eumeta japonica]
MNEVRNLMDIKLNRMGLIAMLIQLLTMVAAYNVRQCWKLQTDALSVEVGMRNETRCIAISDAHVFGSPYVSQESRDAASLRWPTMVDCLLSQMYIMVITDHMLAWVHVD